MAATEWQVSAWYKSYWARLRGNAEMCWPFDKQGRCGHTKSVSSPLHYSRSRPQCHIPEWATSYDNWLLALSALSPSLWVAVAVFIVYESKSLRHNRSVKVSTPYCFGTFTTSLRRTKISSPENCRSLNISRCEGVVVMVWTFPCLKIYNTENTHTWIARVVFSPLSISFLKKKKKKKKEWVGVGGVGRRLMEAGSLYKDKKLKN